MLQKLQGVNVSGVSYTLRLVGRPPARAQRGPRDGQEGQGALLGHGLGGSTREASPESQDEVTEDRFRLPFSINLDWRSMATF